MKKRIDGNKYIKVNNKGNKYISLPKYWEKGINTFFIEKVKLIGKTKDKKDLEIEMDEKQFFEWLDKIKEEFLKNTKEVKE